MPPAARLALWMTILGLLPVTSQARGDWDCVEPIPEEPVSLTVEAEHPLRVFPPAIRSPIIAHLPSPTEVAQGRAAEDSSHKAAPINSVESIQPGDRERRKLKNKAELSALNGTVASEFIFRAPEPSRDAPFERGEWSTEELVHVPVTGPIYVFGQFNLNGEYAADQDMRVIGRTGLSYRVPVSGRPFELRGGPSIRVLDALRAEQARDQAQFLLEVQCRWPLMGTLGLEYDGSALPAMTPLDRPQLRHDVGLALPVAGNGKLKFGAKQQWQGESTTEAYLTVEIGR